MGGWQISSIVTVACQPNRSFEKLWSGERSLHSGVLGPGNHPMGEVCPECGFTDGHNMRPGEVCRLVEAGKVKAMPGLSPEAVGRLREKREERE